MCSISYKISKEDFDHLKNLLSNASFGFHCYADNVKNSNFINGWTDELVRFNIDSAHEFVSYLDKFFIARKAIQRAKKKTKCKDSKSIVELSVPFEE